MILFDFTETYESLTTPGWKFWGDSLRQAIPHAFEVSRNGHLPLWMEIFSQLPSPPASVLDLRSDTVVVSSVDPLLQNLELTDSIRKNLGALYPWRKGSFSIHGVFIDSEWRSSMKWNRLSPHIAPLKGRNILDVGCGNGYYAMRMIGEGAACVIGLDPYLRYIVQHRAIEHFAGKLPIHLIPLGIEHLPQKLERFQTVFSMGVIYHQADPLAHLRQLFEALEEGGQLVLETLVVNGPAETCLIPTSRYAKMRNVSIIPSFGMAESWLARTGFCNPRTVDISRTTPAEQRRTEWMPYESLADFLNPTNPSLTVEGHPAPLRAIMLAEKPCP